MLTKERRCYCNVARSSPIKWLEHRESILRNNFQPSFVWSKDVLPYIRTTIKKKKKKHEMLEKHFALKTNRNKSENFEKKKGKVNDENSMKLKFLNGNLIEWKSSFAFALAYSLALARNKYYHWSDDVLHLLLQKKLFFNFIFIFVLFILMFVFMDFSIYRRHESSGWALDWRWWTVTLAAPVSVWSKISHLSVRLLSFFLFFRMPKIFSFHFHSFILLIVLNVVYY